MTLSTRNRIFLLERIGIFVICLFLSLLFLHSYLKNSIVPPPANINTSHSFLFRYQFSAVIGSIFIFMLYTIITQYLTYKHFAKTRATEILFFSEFLLGCFTEAIRILIPLNGLWESFSPLVLFIGQSVIFGRVLCPLSFLFIAIMSEPEQRLNEERNLTVVLFTSLIFAAFIPINSAHINSNCTLRWGYWHFLLIFRISIFFLAGVSMVLNIIQKNLKKYEKLIIGYVLLIIGYFILCHSVRYATLFLSTLFLGVGTYLYLVTLHRKYMWL